MYKQTMWTNDTEVNQKLRKRLHEWCYIHMGHDRFSEALCLLSIASFIKDDAGKLKAKQISDYFYIDSFKQFHDPQ